MPKLKKYPPLNLILLGDPAAGKATQAEYLAKEYNLFDLDMGKILAHLRRTNKEVNHALSHSTDKGNLTPTKIVRNLFIETITKVPPARGILFDGTPKMLGEAQLVSRLLQKQKRQAIIVIYLSIPMDETIRRMNDRTGYFSGKFGKRADDSNEALKNRVKYYRKNVSAVVEFFSGKYEFHKISALGTRKQVQQRIEKTMKQYLKNLSHGE
jgi:adenylate kinase